MKVDLKELFSLSTLKAINTKGHFTKKVFCPLPNINLT